MAKTKQPRRERAEDETPGKADAAASNFQVFRETLESIVVAFVLAFLFRTFEAEAFVIPTGSMSPSLLGQHKDVNCPQCGYRFRTTASSEGEDRDRLIAELPNVRGMRAEQLKAHIASLDVVGGMCPMCRNLVPMRRDLPANVLDEVNLDDVEYQPSYPGDRILVNKYGLDFGEPQRWDVIVFKFPGDGNMNYIKRLVGLPGEMLRVYQGDLFTRPLDEPAASPKIQRKPADKAAAMLQPVHDTDYESATLYAADWPLRWAATTSDGWTIEAKPGPQTVQQRFSIDQPQAAETHWLRYRHIVPEEDHWRVARAVANEGSLDAVLQRLGLTPEDWQQSRPPQLIADFNPYNARLCRGYAERDGWEIVPHPTLPNAGSLGTQWTPDLAVECDVDVEEARGELALDLVEAGYHFRATINLGDGRVELTVVDGRTGKPLPWKASGQSGIDSAGSYNLRFANVDDQLLLWVDGEVVDCGDATYDPDTLFDGGRAAMLPWRSATGEDEGDLAPVGVGARGAKLTATRLAVWRDIYYIAAKYPEDGRNLVADYDFTTWSTSELMSKPEAWQHFATRRSRDFPVHEGQLFVMGDNSPESKDSRLWMMPGVAGDRPGGPYLDRKLLIGKAVCVFWPHSWGGIPGLPKLPGWPNFKDMRLVR
ncbi:MAG: signal peptidase I [Planctomycetota bacterium]|nr:MAG: signal peptidase I [Planctomycetota bacterium]